MCGRFNLVVPDLEELRQFLPIDDIAVDTWMPRFNIAPRQPSPVLRLSNTGRATVELLEWGLLRTDARDPLGTRPINARVESLAQRPTFRGLLGRRHCIVPATGYYEWQPVGRTKQPWLIAPPTGLLAMAGLWDRWLDGHGNAVETFAVITTDARPELSSIHDRMPLLLEGQGRIARWLRGATDVLHDNTDNLLPLLTTTAISDRVNAPRRDDVQVLEPNPQQPDRQLSLGIGKSQSTPRPRKR